MLTRNSVLIGEHDIVADAIRQNAAFNIASSQVR